MSCQLQDEGLISSRITDLSVACLEAKVKEAPYAVLSTSWGVVEDEAESREV